MEVFQIIAIVFSLLLIGYILRVIRKQRLKEEYSLLWLGISIVFLIFSAWRQGLEKLADLLGIAYAPAALFMLILVGVILILIQFSMIISRLSERSKVLAQEIALMKLEIERLGRPAKDQAGQGIAEPDPPMENA
ncbi:MAG: DUF2304 domain-containing protein [Bacteroidales bacterium]